MSTCGKRPEFRTTVSSEHSDAGVSCLSPAPEPAIAGGSTDGLKSRGEVRNHGTDLILYPRDVARGGKHDGMILDLPVVKFMMNYNILSLLFRVFEVILERVFNIFNI